MKQTPFVIALKSRLPANEWPYTVAALHQDPVIWAALNRSSLGDEAVGRLGQAAAWKPAALALLALRLPMPLAELQAAPLQPLPETWQKRIDARLTHKAEAAEPAADGKPLPGDTQRPPNPQLEALLEAATLALQLRESYRRNSSWRAVLQTVELKGVQGACCAAIACDILPDPLRFLRALVQWCGGHGQPALALHALLCQPIPPETFADQLKALLGDLSPAHGLAVLRELSLHRPRQAQRLAQRFLADQAAVWSAPQTENAADLGEQFYSLAGSLRLAQTYQLAADPDRAVPVLAESLREMRRLRGHLSALLAQAVSKARGSGDENWSETAQETSLEAWKQALQLAPDVHPYVAGLVSALLQADRAADARAYLERRQADGDHHPTLTLASAQVAARLGDQKEAARQAAQTLHLLEARTATLTLEEYQSLAQLLQAEGLSAESLQAARLGLELYPLDTALLNLAAQTGFALGEVQPALLDASAALAGLALEEPDHADPQAALTLRHLMVQTLEAQDEWTAALDERIQALAENSHPTLDELHATITCAQRAGQPGPLMATCRQALALAPEDLLAHRALAQAAQDAGDHTGAALHFEHAARLAPDQPEVWRGLVQAYTQLDQPEQAAEALRQAVQAVPQEAEFHLALGEAYQQQGALSQALNCFRTAVGLGLNGRTPLRLGQTLLQLGRPEEAQAVLEPALAAAGENSLPAPLAAELAYAAAQTRLSLGRSGEAVPLLEQVVQQQPEQPQPRLDLARAILHIPDDAAAARQAMPHLEWLLDETHPAVTDDQRAEGRTLLAEAYAALGEAAKAMQFYRQALDEPANQTPERQMRLATGLGMAALRLDQPEMAVAALKDAVQVQPHDAGLRRRLSEAYTASGLAPEALQAARESVDLEPENVDTLLWLADQADRVRCLPGAPLAAAQSTLQEALNQAARLAPERGDLLLRLGLSHLEDGDLPNATQAFQQLAAATPSLDQVPLETLRKAAAGALQVGEGRLAVQLYQAVRALDPAASRDMSTQVETLTQLSLAHEMAGDTAAALQAVDQALGVDDGRADLHSRKADLLLGLGRKQDALDCLSEAGRRAPRDPMLRYRMAETLSDMARLPEALEQAQAGIAHLDPKTDPALSSSLHLLAADLAAATLRPRLALTHLLAGAPAASPAYHEFNHVALRAELALDTNDDKIAAEAVAEMRSLDDNHPRTHAAVARLRGRRIDPEDRERRCRSGQRAVLKMQLNQTPTTPPSTKEAYIASFLGVAQASIDNRMYDDALKVLDRLIEIIPETPLAYFKRAQVLALMAESQHLCQDLEVSRHAPGAAAIAENTRQQMENAFGQAAGLMGMASNLEVTSSIKPFDDECRQNLGVWMARARAAFTPSLQTARILEALFKVVPPDGAGLAALMCAYRTCGQPGMALQCLQTAWPPAADGSNIRTHALVLVQSALAQPNPRQALIDARSALDNVAFDWPNAGMLHFLIARLALSCQSMDVALTAIGQALAIWPDEPSWQSLASKLYLSKHQALGLPDPAKAMQHLEQAAALAPEEPENHLRMGQIYLDSGQVAKAVPALEQAVHLKPDCGEGWLALAQAQAAVGQWDPAAQSAEKAANFASDPSEALLLRGRIAMHSKNPRGALSRAQAVLRLQPDHSGALYLLSQALEALERPKDALKALERALPHSPDPLALQIERVHLLRRADGLEAALPALQDLAQKNPRRPDISALLANWLLEAGQNEPAVAMARQALQEGKDSLPADQRAALHTLIGLQMRLSGQLDQAIQQLSEAAALAPANLEVLLELGRAYQERREYKPALKVFQKAMGVAGGDYRPYYQAGLVLKDSKDYMAAEAMLRRAAQLAPNEVSIHRLLGAVVALNLVHSNKL